MELLEIKNIARKDSLIHYINKYDGTVVYKNEGSTAEKHIEIILEKTAFGTTNIQLHFDDEVMQNNLSSVEDFIKDYIKQGIFD